MREKAVWRWMEECAHARPGVSFTLRSGQCPGAARPPINKTRLASGVFQKTFESFSIHLPLFLLEGLLREVGDPGVQIQSTTLSPADKQSPHSASPIHSHIQFPALSIHQWAHFVNAADFILAAAITSEQGPGRATRELSHLPICISPIC
ncbi:unnamed protein product [Boreogadus saida]